MSENNKIVVVYKSKSGYTKNYATWLAEELKCDLLEASKVKGVKTPDADQKGLLAAYGHPLDFTSKKNLTPIIECVTN